MSWPIPFACGLPGASHNTPPTPFAKDLAAWFANYRPNGILKT